MYAFVHLQVWGRGSDVDKVQKWTSKADFFFLFKQYCVIFSCCLFFLILVVIARIFASKFVHQSNYSSWCMQLCTCKYEVEVQTWTKCKSGLQRLIFFLFKQYCVIFSCCLFFLILVVIARIFASKFVYQSNYSSWCMYLCTCKYEVAVQAWTKCKSGLQRLIFFPF